MKTYFLKWWLLGMGISIFLVTFFLEQLLWDTNRMKIDAATVQNILYKKQNDLQKYLNEFADKLNNHNYSESTSSIFFNFDQEKLNKNGFVMFLYRNDSLIFWSNHSVQLSKKVSELSNNQAIINLNNGWYYVKKFEVNKNHCLVGLILLKHKFPYENSFLKNQFHKDFSLPDNIEISLIPISASVEVYDKNNTYLFSLLPSAETQQNSFYSNILGIFYFFGLIFVLMFLRQFIFWKNEKFFVKFLTISLILFAIRYLMLEFKFPASLYLLDIFNPQYFTASFWFSSLGDFLLNVILIFFAVQIFYEYENQDVIAKWFSQKPKLFSRILTIFSLFFILFCFLGIENLLKNLIFNSNIVLEPYKVQELSFYSFVTFFIIGILISAFLLLTDKIIVLISKLLIFNEFLILCSAISILQFCIFFFAKNYFNIFSFLFSTSILLIFAIIHFQKWQYQYYTLVLFIAFSAVYSTFYLFSIRNEKEIETRKVLITKLSNERDMLAEHLLQEIEPKLRGDEWLKNFWDSISKKNEDDLHKYLTKKYFHGFWGKYDLELYICKTPKGIFSQENTSCRTEYFKTVEKHGILLKNTDFYFLDNFNGGIGYLGAIDFISPKDKTVFTLFIKLNTKLFTKELGYPELLMDEKLLKNSIFKGYSYAKYKSNTLITQSGNFQYDLDDKVFSFSRNEFEMIKLDDFTHLIYRINDKDLIVLSKPKTKVIEILISISYFFVFFNMLNILILTIKNVPSGLKKFNFNFKMKIQFSMVLMLILSFLLVGGGAIFYNIKQLENKQDEIITEKIQSIVTEIENYLKEEKQLSADKKIIPYGNLEEFLNNLSLIFLTDINLYDLSGHLLASSRPEIFKRGLMSENLHSEAFYQLSINKKARFVQEENIGFLSYTSAYIPVNNIHRMQLAYLNLPYFNKPSYLREEISNIIVTIVNLYVVLFLITIIIAVFLSNKITFPLVFIQEKFKEINLIKKHQQIVYKGKDEIGDLVNEYNCMVEELSHSMELLAKSERENAWREMAKQIAHEIKNPLTPMRLSIQFLLRSWKDKDINFDKRLDRVTRTLIEQIDTLSTIASEFSNFAKMPKANNEVFDIIARLEDCVQLFENTENVSVETDFHNLKNIFIFADKEQVGRVFINLIKNGIQALPEGKTGEIKVETSLTDRNIRVKIQDNGTGISDELKNKIFTPSFTTKSSGMGLGLAIVKSIVENANGRIWFETEVGKGTKFFVEFPTTSKK